MSIWFAIPSARPLEEATATLALWRKQGYRIALFCDADKAAPVSDLRVLDRYPGYAQAVNRLVEHILECDPKVSWIVTGGDDTEPDPNLTAETIGAQCSEHFGGTFGVMQPTGDRWACGSIDTICGSPWMGREFCQRANGGSGPLWREYTHMFVDLELQQVAQKLGILWQRRDLTHLHKHFTRVDGAVDWKAVMPDFLRQANSPEHWAQFQALFMGRRGAGFPGHEPNRYHYVS